jgi:flavorubredoxin
LRTHKTTVDEIADGVFRISTYLPDVTDEGFTMNQYLLLAEDPLLFHTGPRQLFSDTIEFTGRAMRLERLRWISFGHVESDECGALAQWTSAIRSAEVVVGDVAAEVNVRDMTDRKVTSLSDGKVLDLGDKRVRYFATPNVPHAWDAGILFEETTRTLLCGDLFTHLGEGPPVFDGDIVEQTLFADRKINATALTPFTAPTIRRLAELEPDTLATMHGSAYDGDCQEAIYALANAYQRRLEEAMP